MKIFDNKSQEYVDYRPSEDTISMYYCGATVQGSPHLGHMRSAVVYDTFARWFHYIFPNHTTRVIRNITDIDDKILQKALLTGKEYYEIARIYEKEFSYGYDQLGVNVDYEPRATAHIPEIIELIEELINKGYAYQSKNSASVYFRTRLWEHYGELTHQNVDDLQSSGSVVVDVDEKEDAKDFALWKARKDTEPLTASWNSPWGLGRPGWHVECSAMAMKYLGSAFDFHGGGIDLRYPHHENELAQSRAAGNDFARFWLHNGMTTINGEKMSKSIGNVVPALDVLEDYSPQEVRYFLSSAHYRSAVDYKTARMEQVKASLENINAFLSTAAEITGLTFDSNENTLSLPTEFVDAMNNDLNTPVAIAVMHKTVNAGKQVLLQDSSDIESLKDLTVKVYSMMTILGLMDTRSREVVLDSHNGDDEKFSALVNNLVSYRNMLRQEKRYKESDEIRDVLKSLNVSLKDVSSTETTWN